jgi:hypothetical protein
MTARLDVALSFALFALPVSARAQEMSEGQAHVTTRSDVRIAFESVPGTSAAQLNALGQAAGAGLSAIRQCYAETVAQRPTVVGTMRARLSLAERGPLDVIVETDGPGDTTLTQCVRRALTRQDVHSVPRPSAAIAVLSFGNTAAQGAAETARRAEEADHVELTETGDSVSAQGGSRGVRFTVRGPRADREAVAESHRVLNAQIAGLLDCWRRAARRGMDPTGSLELTLAMHANHGADVSGIHSTVRDERAPVCVERALERSPRAPRVAGRVNVVVEFAREE